MANYGILIKDEGDGSFTLLAVNRGTTSTTLTGGTNLLTNTFTQVGGVTTAASGFLNTATDAGDGLGHKLRSVCGAAQRAGEICQNDRAFNG